MINKKLWQFSLILMALVFLHGCASSTRQPAITHNEPITIEDRISGQLYVEEVEKWVYSHGEGLCIKTPRYNVYTTMTDVLLLRQLPIFLENLHQQYCNVSGIKTSQKYDLYLFQTREQWELFGEVFTGSNWQTYKQIEKGAYYANGACVAYNIGRMDTFAVIAHEGWHQFSHRHFKYQLPAWLDEGLAMQFEGFKRVGNKYVFSPSINTIRLNGLKNSFEQGHKPRLANILAENPAAIFDREQENKAEFINAYYSRVYALIRFLDEHGAGVYRPQLTALITAMRDGKWNSDDDIAIALTNRNTVLTTAINARVGLKLFTDHNLKTIERQFDTFCYLLILEHIGS